jgi:hypothetical protein
MFDPDRGNLLVMLEAQVRAIEREVSTPDDS